MVKVYGRQAWAGERNSPSECDVIYASQQLGQITFIVLRHCETLSLQFRAIGHITTHLLIMYSLLCILISVWVLHTPNAVVYIFTW